MEYADGVYTMPQISGSTYVCHKNCERLGGMAAGVYDDFLRQLDGTDSTVKIVPMEDYLRE